MDLRDIGCKNENWIHVVGNRKQQIYVNIVLNYRVAVWLSASEEHYFLGLVRDLWLV
jgi:hypothetical protein